MSSAVGICVSATENFQFNLRLERENHKSTFFTLYKNKKQRHCTHKQTDEAVFETMQSLWLQNQNLPHIGCLAGINFFSPSLPPTILPLLLSLLLSSPLCMQVRSPTELHADFCQ